MSRNASPSTRNRGRDRRGDRETLVAALFTGLNLAVFLILAGSVVAAAILYSQGV